jgi:hypothetical protein
LCRDRHRSSWRLRLSGLSFSPVRWRRSKLRVPSAVSGGPSLRHPELTTGAEWPGPCSSTAEAATPFAVFEEPQACTDLSRRLRDGVSPPPFFFLGERTSYLRFSASRGPQNPLSMRPNFASRRALTRLEPADQTGELSIRSWGRSVGFTLGPASFAAFTAPCLPKAREAGCLVQHPDRDQTRFFGQPPIRVICLASAVTATLLQR